MVSPHSSSPSSQLVNSKSNILYGAIPTNSSSLSIAPPHANHPRHQDGCIEEGVTDDEIDSNEEDKIYRRHSVIEIAPGPINDEVSVISNTINSILGVSLFAMPWGFQQAGMLGGIVVLSGIAWLSFETARMLLISQNTCYLRYGEVFNYPEMAGTTLGAGWSHFVTLCTIISCLGGCTGYVIFFGETVGQAMSLSSQTVIFAATIPLVLLSWIRSFRELTLFAVLGVVALFLTVLLVLYDGRKNMDNWEDIPLMQTKTIPNFMGPATFLFTTHYIVLAMGAEALKLRPWTSFHTTVADGRANSALVISIGLSYLISLILVILVGGLGFMMYRNVLLVRDTAGHPLIGCEDHICQNVILNLSAGLTRDLVGLAMSLVIILSYILMLIPAREHIERETLKWLQLDHEGPGGRKEDLCRNTLRTLLVLGTVAVAIHAPYFGSVMGAVGGLTDALQCFVFPPMIFLALEREMLSRGYQLYSTSIVIFGVMVVGYTFFNIFAEIF